MLRKIGLTALVMASASAVLIPAAPARAQTTQPTPPSNPVAPVAPRNGASPPPEQVAPPDRDLSRTLSRQKGTITPPNVDPGMMVKPPSNGSARTPVIQPPGSRGSNRSVVPK